MGIIMFRISFTTGSDKKEKSTNFRIVLLYNICLHEFVSQSY